MMYGHGHPFTEELVDNIKDLVDRVDKGKASLIVISGGVGEGKTTLTVHILDYINRLRGLPEIDLETGTQLGLGGADFLKKLRVCHEKSLPCVGYDEAGDFSKRGALTNFNAMMNRTFDTFRAFKVIVVMALPNFNVLDQDLFDKKIPRFMLNLKDRTQKYGNYDGYSLYRMELLKSYMKRLKLKNFAFTVVKPNFKGHFLDLDPVRSKQLDKLSTKSKLSILKESEVRIEGLLTYPELATKLFKSVSWARKAIANLRIKPARIIKKIKYFDNYALNLLAEHLDYMSENPKKVGRPPKDKDKKK